jgi:putative drug exporter of the RND superfamily
LIDTLVVRALVVPSIVALLGRWFFWPGGLLRLADANPKVPERKFVSMN